MDNAQRFLNAFVRIEKQLKQLAGVTKYTRFYQLVNQVAKTNSTVRKNELELQEYADLRNAIVHQRSGEGRVIAIPVDEVVDNIEELARRICEPPKISDHFLKPVMICDPQMEIMEACRMMERLKTSKLPVYAQGGYHGLLTTERIVRWMMECQENRRPLKGRISDCLNTRDRKERVLFVERSADVARVQEMFESSLHRGISVSAILITENGSPHQKPIGIITVADLPMLYELEP